MSISFSKISKVPGPVASNKASSSAKPRGLPNSPTIFGLTGFVSKAKLQKQLFRSYIREKKIAPWKMAQQNEGDVFKSFFPEHGGKTFLKKEDVLNNLRSWSKQKTWAQRRDKKELQDKIKILKKATGV